MAFQISEDGQWWISEELASIYQTQVGVKIWVEDNSGPTVTQMRVVSSLEKKVSAIDAQVKLYYEKVAEVVDLSEEGITIDPAHLESHFRLALVYVPRLEQCEDDIFLIHGYCDWEEEHRLQLVVLNSTAVHCGPQSTLIWGSKWDRILSADSAAREILLAED